MYSLIVGSENSLPADRMLEGLDAHLVNVLQSGGTINTRELMNIPVLLMPEIGDSSAEQLARVGYVNALVRSGREYHFQFVPNPNIPPVPSDRIVAAAPKLGITAWDLSRTRWTMKDSDLYLGLLEASTIEAPKPKVFQLPLRPAQPGRVAVMMPFDAGFNNVWMAIKEVVTESGWKCERADDIWLNTAIIDDVVDLIATSEVVICDLTGRNANVFYETGIAHTLGRDVILITQSTDDVPFDLRHHRYVHYLGNREGHEALKGKLASRLQTLMSK